MQFWQGADNQGKPNNLTIKNRALGARLAPSVIGDPKYNMLNKNLLPTYAAQNVLPAYRMATGELTSDKGGALGSYANPGSARLMYSYPGANEAYVTAEEAKAASIKNIFNEVLYLAEIEAPGGGRIKLNPTNADDVNNLKQVVWEYFKNRSVAARENNLQSGWKRTYVSGGKVLFGDKNSSGLPQIAIPNSSIEAEFQQFLIEQLRAETNDFGGRYFNNQNESTFDVYKTEFERVSADRKTMFEPTKDGKLLMMKMQASFRRFNSSLFNDGIIAMKGIPFTKNIDRAGYFTNNYLRFVKADDFNTTYVKYTFSEDKSDGLPTLTKDIIKYMQIAPDASAYPFNYQPISVDNVSELKNLKFDAERYYHQDLLNPYAYLNEGYDHHQDTMPSLYDLPESLKNSAAGPTMLSNNDLIQNIAVNFANSRLVEYQQTELKDSDGENFHHYLRPAGINNIELNFELDMGAVLNKYADRFAQKLAKNPGTNVQIGYFYGGKLMFTQSATDLEKTPTTVVPATNLKNVSYTAGETNSGDEGLKKLWNADTFSALLTVTKTLPGLGALAESEVLLNKEEDAIRQLFTFATKYKKDLDNLTEEKQIERFQWLVKYDPGVKWLSFAGISSVNLVKQYNIITESNLNPSVTTLTKDNALVLNGAQLNLFDPVNLAKLNETKLKYAPQVAQIWVFYNVQGQKVFTPSHDQADPSMYDALELMQNNIITYESTRAHGLVAGFIDNAHVFYLNRASGALQLVINQTSEIYRFTHEKSLRFFRTYDDLTNYVKNEIVKINASLIA